MLEERGEGWRERRREEINNGGLKPSSIKSLGIWSLPVRFVVSQIAAECQHVFSLSSACIVYTRIMSFSITSSLYILCLTDIILNKLLTTHITA